MVNAPATPAKFPVPTVAANAVHNARKEVVPPRASAEAEKQAKNRRSALGSKRNWANPVRTLK